MSELDGMLRGTFNRVAEPGDPAGVADIIRSRVAAGDPGTPAESAVFDVGSGWPWLPWIGGGAVVAIVGVVAGLSGVFGAAGLFGDGTPAAAGPPPSFGVTHAVAGLDCPAGSPVVAFDAGDRVLAVARSDEGGYLGVRSPADRSRTVWVALDDLELDGGQPDIADLEVDGCSEPLIDVEEPQPEPEPEPQPKPQPKPEPQPGPVTPPKPKPDTTAPTLGNPSGTQNIGCTSGYGVPESTTISISANDNQAATKVAINWAGADSGSGQMSPSWSFQYNPPGATRGDVTFTMVALDAAGNASPAKSFTVYVDCLF